MSLIKVYQSLLLFVLYVTAEGLNKILLFVIYVLDDYRDGRGYIYDPFNRYYRVRCFHFEISSRTIYYVDILLSGRIDSCLRKLTTLKQSCLIRL